MFRPLTAVPCSPRRFSPARGLQRLRARVMPHHGKPRKFSCIAPLVIVAGPRRLAGPVWAAGATDGAENGAVMEDVGEEWSEERRAVK